MIRDTSSQDTQLSTPGQRFPTKYRAALGLAVVLLLLLGGWAVKAWLGSSQSVNASRLRIAEVTTGNLVRDAAVNGRVVAAVSPTLYATATGSVTLKTKAGDTVKKGQVLAVIESLDVQEALKREQSALAGC